MAGFRTGAGPTGAVVLPTMCLIVALVAWLWPIGVGGKMPVGGDVTQFSIGLMAVLREAIRSGRLPLWNDLWGFGFPGVAESQMGAFYPPHILVYGLFSTEAAYTVNLVAHTIWGGLGAAWAARRFGISAWGSALSGFCWATSGFFLIHLPHHWAYTTGSWMPWAWGLGWSSLRRDGPRRAPWILAPVLALQVLPGHFQLAFCTQVGLTMMGLWALVERPGGARRAAWAVGGLGAALAAMVPLAAMQLWPTYRLALLAKGRDVGYLSDFAATPLHLVSYVAPGLFHHSPLWRPVAWDPFHTSPEEHLDYVGLVPLFLAFGAIKYGWRRDEGVRLLVVLALATLLLGLGPYFPGFALWSRVPGFSFFRAPARWGLATSLALALLAGKGFDGLRGWPRPGRSLVRFVALAAAAPLLVVAGFELALASTEGPGWPEVAAGFDRALRSLPWSNDPSFRDLMARARRPQDDDLRVPTGLARAGFPAGQGGGPRLRDERFRIYLHEWGETGLVLVGLLALAPFAGRARAFKASLLLLTAIDLWCVGRHRTIDFGPIRPLAEQSRVLGHLAGMHRGTRTIDGLRNLPMVAGAAPVSAYRTLDLPVLPSLTGLAYGPPDSQPIALAALRAVGAGVRVFDPFEVAGTGRRSPRADPEGAYEVVDDPVLAGWLYGADWIASPAGSRATTFALWRPNQPATRAWLVPHDRGRTLADLAANTGDPARVLEAMDGAVPLTSTAAAPEHVEVAVLARGPGAVVISQLDYPEWRARWSGPGGDRPARIVRVFGGWQGVEVPGPGSWTLHLDYPGRDVRAGVLVSSLAWLSGIVACWWRARVETKEAGPAPGRSGDETT